MVIKDFPGSFGNNTVGIIYSFIFIKYYMYSVNTLLRYLYILLLCFYNVVEKFR